MLKRSVFIITVFVLLCFLLASCTGSGKADTSDVSKETSRHSITSHPDTTSRTVSEESVYDNASIGENSEGIIDDIVSGAGDIVSGVASGIEDAFDGK